MVVVAASTSIGLCASSLAAVSAMHWVTSAPLSISSSRTPPTCVPMNRPLLVCYALFVRARRRVRRERVRARGFKPCLPGAAMKRSPDPDFMAVFVCQHNLWVPFGGVHFHFQLCSEHIWALSVCAPTPTTTWGDLRHICGCVLCGICAFMTFEPGAAPRTFPVVNIWLGRLPRWRRTRSLSPRRPSRW